MVCLTVALACSISAITTSRTKKLQTSSSIPKSPEVCDLTRSKVSCDWKLYKFLQNCLKLKRILNEFPASGIVFLYQRIMEMKDNVVGGGAVLADAMGLGKTLQCIALVWALLKQGPYGYKPVLKRVIIVTPGKIVRNRSVERRGK
jgi:SNF2 family DNA or RNA helicase